MPATEHGDLATRFRAAAEAAAAHVHIVPSHDLLAAAIAAVLRQAKVERLVAAPTAGVTAVLEDEALRSSVASVTTPERAGDRGWQDACFAADAGLTDADFGLAETGTLVLCDSSVAPSTDPGEGVHLSGARPPAPVPRRGDRARLASLAPPLHLAILDRAAILPDLGALLDRGAAVLRPARHSESSWPAQPALRAAGTAGPTFPGCVTLITGPSRTADIEKKLVLGVHGPAELHIFLVDS